MSDRGMVKWAPFSSVVNGNILVDNLDKKRSKISKPILSEEELEKINYTIIESYQNLSKVIIKYYKAGSIYTIKGIITSININDSNIILDKINRIYFSQILSMTNE